MVESLNVKIKQGPPPFQGLPRLHFAHLPTKLERLDRVSAELGLNLWIKRDDQTGFETSGNKIRKLEYLVANALGLGATCLVTCGGIQSNHCRATAALAARLGLRCVLFLRGEKPPSPSSANHLLDQIFGAEILYLTDDQYYNGMADAKQWIFSQVASQGGKAYFIPEGGSNEIGCIGYADAFAEVVAQCKDESTFFDSIVVAHGSGGTQAGLVLGKLLTKGSGSETKIVGVNVCYDAEQSRRLVKDLLWSVIQKNSLPLSFAKEDLIMLDGFRGDGYAKTTQPEMEFYYRIAQREGILLDPVYTGKAFLALFQSVTRKQFDFGKNVLFWHTGGGFGSMRGDFWSKAGL